MSRPRIAPHSSQKSAGGLVASCGTDARYELFTIALTLLFLTAAILSVAAGYATNNPNSGVLVGLVFFGLAGVAAAD